MGCAATLYSTTYYDRIDLASFFLGGDKAFIRLLSLFSFFRYIFASTY